VPRADERRTGASMNRSPTRPRPDDPAQRSVHDAIASGPRRGGAAPWPSGSIVRSSRTRPGAGRYCRFETRFRPRCRARDLVIARVWARIRMVRAQADRTRGRCEPRIVEAIRTHVALRSTRGRGCDLHVPDQLARDRAGLRCRVRRGRAQLAKRASSIWWALRLLHADLDDDSTSFRSPHRPRAGRAGTATMTTQRLGARSRS